ncbi:hypothetical protein MSAN_01211100 [Mycena sanguinolenta]|uniref:Uncharacterized protein n=1 Tax=Mycena sanguinolenta TaxID=230812 RepID=A0A8H7D4K3_9AGAR|nr:hypothetical protein MSAN_01211100 [Mycena sanguinolenta]
MQPSVAFPRCLLALVLLFSAFVSCVRSEVLMTNAQRMSQGLPPAPPKRLYEPTRVRRVAAAQPSPSHCSQIGSINMAIEMHRVSTGSFMGYVGPTTYYINTIYSGGYGGSGNKAGLLFNVEKDDYYAITLAGKAPHAFCAEVNQYSQDLYNVDSSYTSEPNNYLFNVDCSSPGGYTQRADYFWDSNGVIGLEWLQPDGTEVFPVPWWNSNTQVFRWYPPGVTPTYTGHNANNNPWYQVYLKWTCTNP